MKEEDVATTQGERKLVLSFGEALWDLLPNHTVLGGAPCNFACRVNSLGDRALLISRLGNDALGRKAGEQISALGLETGSLQWDDQHPTGTVKVSLDLRHNPDYYIVPEVAYDYLELNQNMLDLAASADCFCFGTLVQRASQSRHTLYQLLEARGDKINLLDINLRENCYSEETIRLSLEQATVLKLNESEAEYLARLFGYSWPSIPDFCEQMIAAHSLSHCVLTLGDRGVFAVTAGREGIYVPGYRIALVDSCGSGDAFAAGFVHALLHRQTLADCCQLGNALGAMVASQPGATTPIAKKELLTFLEAEHGKIVDSRLKTFRTE